MLLTHKLHCHRHKPMAVHNQHLFVLKLEVDLVVGALREINTFFLPYSG